MTKVAGNVTSKPQPGLGYLLKERYGEDFFSNQTLRPLVSSGVGGVAEYIVVAKTTNDLIDAAKLAASNKVEFRVIAGGTGTLVSDVGFAGLVIVDRTQGMAFNPDSSLVLASSGIENHKLISACATQGLGGIEFLSAVPGSIAGAAVTNAGYGGNNISTAIKDLTMLITEGSESKIVTVLSDELKFSPYRSLFLKQSVFPPVILTVRLQLARLQQEEIIRRLSFYKKRNEFVLSTGSILGSFLTPPVEELRVTELKELQKIRLPGFKINTREGTLQAVNDKVTAVDFRNAIEKVISTESLIDANLEERVTYLGYWPDGEDAEQK